MFGLGTSGALAWIMKPGMAMYLGIAMIIPWFLFITSLSPIINGYRNGEWSIGAFIRFALGLFGLFALGYYGSHIAEVRGPLIFMIWSAIVCIGFLAIYSVFSIFRSLIHNGKSRKSETVVVEVPQNRVNQSGEDEVQRLSARLQPDYMQGNLRPNPVRQSRALQDTPAPQRSGYQGQPQRVQYQGPAQNPYQRPPQQQQYGRQPQQSPYQRPVQQPQRPVQQQQYGRQPQPQPQYRRQQYGRQPQQPQNPYQGHPQNQRQPYNQTGYGTGSLDEDNSRNPRTSGLLR